MAKERKAVRIRIGDKMFKETVFRVESFDEKGRPEHLTFVPEDRAVELSRNPDENRFAVGFMDERWHTGALAPENNPGPSEEDLK